MKATIKRGCPENCRLNPEKRNGECSGAGNECDNIAYCCPCGSILLTHFVSTPDGHGLEVGIQGRVVCPACGNTVEIDNFPLLDPAERYKLLYPE